MRTYELIDGIKVKIERNRTQIIDCKNMLVSPQKRHDNDKPPSKSNSGKYTEYNYRKRIKKRADKIKELCYNNFDRNNAMFVTLTFDVHSVSGDMTDRKNAHAEFKLFIKRINDHFDNFKYIATFARQKNNVWHYHMICNFDIDVTGNQIADIWKHGFISTSFISTEQSFKNRVEYLVKNMKESYSELRGARGYLNSQNVEHSIVISSWRPEHTAEFKNVTDTIMTESVYNTYSTKKRLGVVRNAVDIKTGEEYEQLIPRIEFTDKLKESGFSECEASYTYYSASYKFTDRFEPIVMATRKPKKFRHKKKKSNTPTN